MLRVLGPVVVRGFTFKVAFWVGMRRRILDETWLGLILIWNVLYVHFSRASDRLYVLIEDLRAGISLPPSGALINEARDVGVYGVRGRHSLGDDSKVRHQLQLARLIVLFDTVWNEMNTGNSPQMVWTT